MYTSCNKLVGVYEKLVGVYLKYIHLQVLYTPTSILQDLYNLLDPSCYKYCDLIGQSRWYKSHITLVNSHINS